VAIAGAGIGGLVAGAILARHGLRVVVADLPPLPGSRAGSTPWRGFWLDGGQRDGCDVGDLQVGWRHGQRAAQAADVAVPIHEVPANLRIHHLHRSGREPHAQVVSGTWGARGFAAMAEQGFGCPRELLPELGAVLARLAAAPEAERKAARTARFGAWLEAEVSSAALRRALLTMVAVIFCEQPERASTGRLMAFFGRSSEEPKLITGYADDDQVGGMQGVLAPFARAVEERAGRLLLGVEPREVLFQGERAAGLVVVDPQQLAQEIRARAVVLALPLWNALPLLPPERVDPGLAALSRALEDEQAAAVGWQAALRRLPRLRDGGTSEAHVGWNRILVGPERRYHGGFHLPSLASRRSAPAGRHLLHAYVAHWLRHEERFGWDAARRAIQQVIDYLHHFYRDLDECLEWAELQWVAPPACLSWYWAPLERHGVRAPGCPGLYLAGSTIESDAGPVDIGAHAGLLAATSILEDLPELASPGGP